MIISWVVLGFEALKHISECVVPEATSRETWLCCGAASLARPASEAKINAKVPVGFGLARGWRKHLSLGHIPSSILLR